MHYSSHLPNKRNRPVRRFFGAIWGLITWLRTTLANLLFLVILAVIILVLMPAKPEPLPERFALTLAPTGVLVDQRSHIDPLELLLSDGAYEAETPVRDLVLAIQGAAIDPRVHALVLELDGLLGGGISKLEEVGAALRQFRDSGKPVLALGDHFTQEQYYLASYADRIYLHDMGAVLLTGYGSYRPYFKSALDKLHINFHVFRVGKYKDFAEPYMLDRMSDESREHNSQWLNQLWGVYTTRVEELRSLPIGALNDYINNLDQKLRASGGSASRLALDSGLVDELVDHRQGRKALIEQLGANEQGDNYLGVGAGRYLADLQRREKPARAKVGLLIASGAIVEGHQPEGTIGSATLAEQLQAIREEGELRALVIRIDSGGGSAFASELIRAEIEATRASGIPVLVSMGSVAASGGYWMAAGADEVWATPTTLTGSIGVFGAFPTFEGSLDRLGIHTDGIGTTELAGAMRLDRPLSAQAGNIIQQSVDNIYQRFVELVAEARGASPEEIHELAQGRVWSGATALELGLVDQLGHLDEVLAAAAQHAGLTEYSVELISRELSPRELLLRQLSGVRLAKAVPEAMLANWLAPATRQQLQPLLKPLRELGLMNDPRGVYASCPECLAP